MAGRALHCYRKAKYVLLTLSHNDYEYDEDEIFYEDEEDGDHLGHAHQSHSIKGKSSSKSSTNTIDSGRNRSPVITLKFYPTNEWKRGLCKEDIANKMNLELRNAQEGIESYSNCESLHS